MATETTRSITLPSSPVIDRYASVIPLDYEGHPEHAVLMFDPNWENLVELLANPQAYLREAYEHWGASTGSEPAWIMQESISAILRPAFSEALHSGPAIVGVLDDLGEPWREYVSLDGRPNGPEGWPQLLQDLWAASPTLRRGGFYLEFAVNTAALTVHYFPPFAVKENRHGGAGRYGGSFSSVTVSVSPSLLGATCGTVHVDLEDSNSGPVTGRQVAQFLVDMLEDRNWFAERLNELRRFTIPHRLSKESAPVTEFRPTPRDFLTPFAPPARVGITGLPFDLPTLRAIGLTPGKESCCLVCSFFESGDEYVLGDFLMKIYPPKI